MTDQRARDFAAESRCVVVAAAGCGKTELIARSVVASGGRQLVLTHTHAGVRALRDRLREKNADPATYEVDTISGFCLRYAAAFPSLSGCQVSEPSNADWPRVYDGAKGLLTQRHVRDVVTNSYTGLFVDEYQDCTLKQHDFIRGLADLLPTRIVGDPLQGIFDFSPKDPLVDWSRDVFPTFKQLPDLGIPYRWLDKNPALGEWLTDARKRLLLGEQINLDGGAPVRWVSWAAPGYYQATQISACLSLLRNAGDSIAVIRKLPAKAHAMAKMLRGNFRSMEEVECKDLLKWCDRLEASTGMRTAELVLEFAFGCMTAKARPLDQLHKLLGKGELPGDSRLRDHAPLKEAARAVAADGGVSSINTMLQLIENMPGVTLYRRELYREMRRVMQNHDASSGVALRSTAWRIRDRARRFGRVIDRRLVSRTPLIKGLEFDHAIIVDVADFDDAKNLYVALTRGAKSLTVMSASPTIQMTAPQFVLPVSSSVAIR